MTDAASQSPPQRSARRRWILRFAIAAISLAAVIVVFVQIVLSTAIPKEIVVAQLQRISGFHITAKHVSTGWFGHTTLQNLTFSLPLAEQPFLEIPELHVTHTVLPVLLLTQSIDLHSISIDRPKLLATQNRDGRWNMQDVAELLAAMSNSGQSPTNQKGPTLTLPHVNLSDGEIVVADNAGRQTTITPFNLTGQPINALAWKYDASCDSAEGAHIHFAGRIAPGDNFSHEANFELSNLAALTKPWSSAFDPAASLKGQWTGAKTNDGIAGRLKLEKLRYRNVTAERGDISVTASNESFGAAIAHLIVDTKDRPFDTVTIMGGTLSLDSGEVTLNGLDISAINGRALLSGAFGLANQSGNLHGEWKSLQPASTIGTSGTIDATLGSNWPDQRIVKIDLATSGYAAEQNYIAKLQLTGIGNAWDNANWTLAAPVLNWSGRQSVVLDHLVAHLTSRPGQITLADLSLPGASTVGGGGGVRFDARNLAPASCNWWLYLHGDNWTIPNAAGASLVFGVNAWGDANQIRLEQAFGIVGRIYSGLDGYYRFAHPKPVDLNLNVCELPAPTGAGPDIIRGNVRGEGVLNGTLIPLSLDAAGQLHGDQIVIDNHAPQRIDVRCTAGLHQHLFSFDTEELALLGGQWSVHGQIPARESSHGNAPDVTIRIHDLPLQNIGDLIHQTGIAGVAAGSLEVDIDKPALNQITAWGQFQAKYVRAQQFKADSATADVLVKNGLIQVSPIQLRLADGHALATLSTTLSNPQLISVSLDATDWPADAGSVHAVVSVKAPKLLIDVKSQTADGQVNFNAAAHLQDRPLLKADGIIGITGRVLDLQNLNAKVLDGSASGSGTVDIDHPLTARGTLRWDALNLANLASYDNLYQSASGFITGRADLAPTTDPRALGPLMLDIAAVGQSAKYRNVNFAEAHLPIFFDEGQSGTYRAVLSDGKVDVSDGSIGLFARASMHAQDTLSTQIEATLDGLDLEQLLHAADKSEADKIKSFPGRLSGLVSIVGDPRDRLQLFGQASLQVHDSDLGSFGPFVALYDTMHLGGTWGKKVGEGTAEARYDNDSIIVSSLRYYNRGVDAYGLAAIKNLKTYPDSPLSGELVGTYRPLKNVKLPFFADADKIFSVLQSSLTSIVIGGTKRRPSYVPESASAIGSAMRSFLLGDVPQPK